jgi:hypothetical protein
MRFAALLMAILILASGAESSTASLEWLEGCWVSADGSSHEVWVIDDDTSLIGFSIARDGATLAFYEVLSIRLDEDGAWIYHAHPSGQAATKFVAREITERSVIFANPGHDYPQEIRYRRDGDTLYASTSLLGGAKPRSFDKVACE